MANANGTTLPVDDAVIFTNHKEKQTRGVEKRQGKLLAKIEFLRPFLQDGERILLITTACSPIGALEQLTTGWIVFYIKRSLLVFTDRRLFHIPTTRNFDYRGSIAQINYADCAELRLRFGSLRVRYQTGRKETFPYVARGERKKIKSLLTSLPLDTNPSSKIERTFLCPRCTTSLEKGTESCKQCRLEFKHRRDARWISILLPGGGYFYTRHPVMGFFDAVFELYLLWVIYLYSLGELRTEEGASAVAVMFTIVLAVEKLVTIYHSNHFLDEFLTVEREVTVRGAHAS
ncbi:MAG: hypothetical protein HUJ31_03525 [Pseudomonadales bacterium]|nr:hypothetical protein [Pseudomonadales bacterium]